LIATDLAVFRALYFNTLIVSNHMNATLVLGQPDFTSSSSGTSATTMKFATAAWTDGTRILVGDWINQRVLYWSSYPSANGGAATAALGASDLNTIGMLTPRGVFSDANRVYASDLGVSHILVWNQLPTTSVASADVVLGGAPGVSDKLMNGPIGVAVAN